MKEQELAKRQDELTRALWDAYNTLEELYRPLQVNSIKKKIDNELNIWGYEDLDELFLHIMDIQNGKTTRGI